MEALQFVRDLLKTKDDKAIIKNNQIYLPHIGYDMWFETTANDQIVTKKESKQFDKFGKEVIKKEPLFRFKIDYKMFKDVKHCLSKNYLSDFVDFHTVQSFSSEQKNFYNMKDNHLYCFCTDSYRVKFFPIGDVPSNFQFKTKINNEFVYLLDKPFIKKQDVYMELYTDGTVGIIGENFRMNSLKNSTRQFETIFNYDNRFGSVNRKELLEIVEPFYKSNKKEFVTVNFNNKVLTISSIDPDLSKNINYKDYTGDEISVLIKINFLYEMLKNMRGEVIDISRISKKSPVFCFTDGDNFEIIAGRH